MRRRIRPPGQPAAVPKTSKHSRRPTGLSPGGSGRTPARGAPISSGAWSRRSCEATWKAAKGIEAVLVRLRELIERSVYEGEIVGDPGTAREGLRRACVEAMNLLRLGGAGATIAGEPVIGTGMVAASSAPAVRRALETRRALASPLLPGPPLAARRAWFPGGVGSHWVNSSSNAAPVGAGAAYSPQGARSMIWYRLLLALLLAAAVALLFASLSFG